MMIGHCIFIIKHFCAAVNFDYRLGGKLKIYFQPPPPRDNANYYCIATNCTKGSDLSPLHSLHTLCVCYAGRANADVVFLNCPTSFATVREISIWYLRVSAANSHPESVREAACFLDVRWRLQIFDTSVVAIFYLRRSLGGYTCARQEKCTKKK